MLKRFLSCFSKDKTMFLPLHLKSVKTEHLADNKTKLHLVTDCGTISLNIVKDYLVPQTKYEEKPKLLVHDVESVNVELEDSQGGKTSCVIGEPKLRRFIMIHYKCKGDRTYSCQPNQGGHPLKLVITDLEFEVNGNKDLIGKGMFSTRGDKCI